MDSSSESEDSSDMVGDSSHSYLSTDVEFEGRLEAESTSTSSLPAKRKRAKKGSRQRRRIGAKTKGSTKDLKRKMHKAEQEQSVALCAASEHHAEESSPSISTEEPESAMVAKSSQIQEVESGHLVEDAGEGSSAMSSADASGTAPKRKYRKGPKLTAPRKRHKPKQEGLQSDTSNVDDESITAPPSEESAFYEGIIYDVVEDEVDLTMHLETPADSVDAEELAYDENVEELGLMEFIAEEDPFCDLQGDFPDVEPIAEGGMQLSYVDIVASNMLLLLSKEWIVDTKDGTSVRLYLVSPYENVSVLKAIIWKDGAAKFFVHNKPLPPDHFIWNCMEFKDDQNIGEVCDNLQRAAHNFQHAHVCDGVVKHKQFWSINAEQNKGVIENNVYKDYECFRATKCNLITIDSTKCLPCKQVQRLMKDQALRALKDSDRSKVNIRYLSKDELSEKARSLQAEKRKLQKKMARLQNKVKKIVSRNSLVVSHDFSEDLAKIFKENHSTMSDVQRLFWSEQLKALSARQKNPRTMRWNPFVIKLALHLQMISRSAYNYVKNFIALPSQRLLYDYSHAIEAKEGAQESILKDLSDQAKNFNEHECYFNLCFDEMHIRSDIVIDRKSGEVIGYTNLSSVEEELARLETEVSPDAEFVYKPAKKILVYLSQSITNTLQAIVGLYPTGDLSASQLFSRTWHIIYRMESYGLKVLCLICDGASINKKFFQMHPSLNSNLDFTYGTTNFVSSDMRPLFFIVDPPHLLKSLRNCLANSYSHKKTRKLWKNNEDLSWRVIEILFELTVHEKFRNHKLTRAHIKLTAFSCMKVGYAAQTMSQSVAKAILDLKDHSAFQGQHTNELCQFISHVNDSFDCFNGSGDKQSKRHRVNRLLDAYDDVSDPRFVYLTQNMLKFFESWWEDILKRQNKGRMKFSKDAKEKMFISHQSYNSLRITTHGFIGAIRFILSKGATHVQARKFNQDKLEQYFGILRMSGGGSRNPNIAEVLQKSVSIHVQGKAAKPSSKGNTEVTRQVWIPDETPLPKLKKGEK